MHFQVIRFWVDPNILKLQKSEKRYTQLRQQVNASKQEIDQLETALKSDPEITIRNKLSNVSNLLKKIDLKLKNQTVDLIPAYKMSDVLEKVLSQTKKLRMINFQSKKPIAMLDLQVADSGLNLYQHGLLLTFEGKYFDILNFLQNVENLPWRLYWNAY